MQRPEPGDHCVGFTVTKVMHASLRYTNGCKSWRMPICLWWEFVEKYRPRCGRC